MNGVVTTAMHEMSTPANRILGHPPTRLVLVPASFVFVFCFCQADVSSAREGAMHIGAVLGPGTRALIAQMRATTQHNASAGGDGYLQGAGEAVATAGLHPFCAFIRFGLFFVSFFYFTSRFSSISSGIPGVLVIKSNIVIMMPLEPS